MKQRVWVANLRLKKEHLVYLTWGNASEINREAGLIVIKPSGIDYAVMAPEDMVLTDLEGNLLEEDSLLPSSDLATHVKIYQSFPRVGAIVHTHSSYAVMWAQAIRDIPPYGMTQAVAFGGAIPVTQPLSNEQIKKGVEKATGEMIVKTVENREKGYLTVPCCLAAEHGPFIWGTNTTQAIENAILLEEAAKTALFTEMLNPDVDVISDELLEKQYLRKHEKNGFSGLFFRGE
ncbi:MAG: L-ribulose-5-phosphate 4-epimerase AraD [Streptococcaceae bacterium]|jgi:L-ribulose-5-phosphate 4-epimerase|nr:L-ribulose-5-phosphate 4-epimerase AraD [Streptococcaceae bacterium]